VLCVWLKLQFTSSHIGKVIAKQQGSDVVRMSYHVFVVSMGLKVSIPDDGPVGLLLEVIRTELRRVGISSLRYAGSVMRVLFGRFSTEAKNK